MWNAYQTDRMIDTMPYGAPLNNTTTDVHLFEQPTATTTNDNALIDARPDQVGSSQEFAPAPVNTPPDFNQAANVSPEEAPILNDNASLLDETIDFASLLGEPIDVHAAEQNAAICTLQPQFDSLHSVLRPEHVQRVLRSRQCYLRALEAALGGTSMPACPENRMLVTRDDFDHDIMLWLDMKGFDGYLDDENIWHVNRKKETVLRFCGTAYEVYLVCRQTHSRVLLSEVFGGTMYFNPTDRAFCVNTPIDQKATPGFVGRSTLSRHYGTHLKSFCSGAECWCRDHGEKHPKEHRPTFFGLKARSCAGPRGHDCSHFELASLDKDRYILPEQPKEPASDQDGTLVTTDKEVATVSRRGVKTAREDTEVGPSCTRQRLDDPIPSGTTAKEAWFPCPEHSPSMPASPIGSEHELEYKDTQLVIKSFEYTTRRAAVPVLRAVLNT